MMTRPRKAHSTSDPGDFIASIPATLSYLPTESIVLTVGINDPLIMVYVIRFDLPESPEVSSTAQDLRSIETNQSGYIAKLLVIGGNGTDPADLPHRDLVNQLAGVLNELDISVAQALWIERIEHGLPWRSYLDPDSTGPVGDPTQFPISTTHEVVLDDDTLVHLGQGLTHSDVRNAVELALTEQVEPSERLWTLLTRALPRSLVAHPASLLAICLYLRGEQALARVGIDIALEADPDHRMARTLRKLFDLAILPHDFESIFTEANRQAHEELDAKNRDKTAQP